MFNRTTTIALLAATAGLANAGDLFLLDFESSAGYSTSVSEFTDGSGDYFMRTSGTGFSSSVNYLGADGTYFAGQDLDGEGAGLPLVLTTDTFNIAGASSLMFAIDLAEDNSSDGNEDWDASDSVAIEYSLDGGTWTSIFSVINDGSTFNSAAFVSGTEVSDTFSTFGADLSALSGSTLAIRLVWDLNAGDEDLAIDNIYISGTVSVVPLPPAAWAGLGMLGLMGACRLRRNNRG